MKKAISVVSASILTASLACGGFVMANARDKKPATEVRNIGNPVSCVQTRSIKSTDVVDKNTIDFKMLGGKVFRNSLPYSCPSLGLQEAFSYRLSTGQLCSVDIIRVLETGGGGLREGAACGLGKFQQIETVKPPK